MDTATFFKNRKKMLNESEIDADYNENVIPKPEIKLENDVEVKVERIESDNLFGYDTGDICQEELIMDTDIVKIETSLDASEKSSKTVYDCQQCTANFNSNQARSKHYKTEHNIEKFQCSYCNKKLSKLGNLNRHINYSCPKNEQKKNNNDQKKYGMYTHPFICDLCKKSFTHKNTLRIHLKKHYGTSVLYRCHLCKKSYTKKHNLKCHIKSYHFNTDLYCCNICHKGFGWRWALLSHEKNQHGMHGKKLK